jgi:hypothetical protein
MNECMCICMYACMHVCMYTYVHAEGYTAAATTERYDMYPPPPRMYMQRDILLLQLQKVANDRRGAGGQARKANSQDQTTV